MLQQDTPDDYVIATGETHSIKELLEVAFGALDMNYEDYVVIDPQFVRPAEVDLLLGSPEKAKRQMGWEPTVTFEGLVHMMVEADMKRITEQVKS